ncbi:hypothetical protein Tco_1262464 [Tanacetum coccineum]
MEDRREKPPRVRRLTWHLETLMTLVALRIWLRIVLWILVHRYMLPCKEELERFRLHSSKVRLADDNTLDIASIRDVVLKTSFGTSWTLKDVRYISCLKRRLISVGKLDKEGYHVASETSSGRIGMSMLASKGNVPDVRKVDIYFCKSGSLGKQKNLSFIMSVKTKKLQSRSCGRYNANLQVKCLKSDNDGEYNSVSTAYLIYRIPYVLIGLHILEEEWRGKDTSLGYLKIFGCDSFVNVKDVCGEAMKSYVGAQIRVRGPETVGALRIVEDQMKKTLKIEHPLRREALALYSYDDPSRRVKGFTAIIKEMVSLEKNQTCSLVRISTRKKASQRLWMFKVKEDQNNSERYEASLSIVAAGAFLCGILECYIYTAQKRGIPCIESLLALCLVSEVCSNMLAATRKVRAVALFKGSGVSYVWQYRKVRAVALLKGIVVRSLQRLLEMESSKVISLQSGIGGPATLEHVASCIVGREAYCSTSFGALQLARSVQCKLRRHAVSTDHAVWHEPE